MESRVVTGGSARQKQICGVVPVLAAPLTTDLCVDETMLDREIGWLVDSGARWLAIGFGSEIGSLDPQEARRLERCTAAARGAARVVGNVGQASTVSSTLRRLDLAVDAGADAVMLHPTDERGRGSGAVAAEIASIAAVSPVPLVVQDAPQHTGVNLTVEDLGVLAGCDGIAALKIEPPDAVAKIRAVSERRTMMSAPILAGRGAVQLHREVRAGAEGTMPGAGLFPEIARVFRFSIEGKWQQAVGEWSRLAPLMLIGERSFKDFVQLQKTILTSRGVFQNDLISEAMGSRDAGMSYEVECLLDAIEVW
jgi:4-hydroxy-tetrahydrodipicolinate synthase